MAETFRITVKLPGGALIKTYTDVPAVDVPRRGDNPRFLLDGVYRKFEVLEISRKIPSDGNIDIIARPVGRID